MKITEQELSHVPFSHRSDRITVLQIVLFIKLWNSCIHVVLQFASRLRLQFVAYILLTLDLKHLSRNSLLKSNTPQRVCYSILAQFASTQGHTSLIGTFVLDSARIHLSVEKISNRTWITKFAVTGGGVIDIVV